MNKDEIARDITNKDAYKMYIHNEEITDRSVLIRIRNRNGFAFDNEQFSNEAFKKLTEMDYFTVTGGGTSFYFEVDNRSLAIRKSSKQKFAEEAEELRKQFIEVAKFIAENINEEVENTKGCRICGYTEFESLSLQSNEGRTWFKSSEANISSVKIRYCKKCRTAVVHEY